MGTKKNVLIASKTTYAIKAFSSVKITANALNRLVTIKLLNVTLASRFLINLIYLRRFTDKSVY
jgi:hypothetical protein